MTEELEVIIRRLVSPDTSHFEKMGLPLAPIDPTGAKAVFRKLVLKVHPDKCQDPRAAEAFKALNEAYEVINDPARQRAHLSNELHKQQQQQQRQSAFYNAASSRGTKRPRSASSIPFPFHDSEAFLRNMGLEFMRARSSAFASMFHGQWWDHPGASGPWAQSGRDYMRATEEIRKRREATRERDEEEKEERRKEAEFRSAQEREKARIRREREERQKHAATPNEAYRYTYPTSNTHKRQKTAPSEEANTSTSSFQCDECGKVCPNAETLSLHKIFGRLDRQHRKKQKGDVINLVDDSDYEDDDVISMPPPPFARTTSAQQPSSLKQQERLQRRAQQQQQQNQHQQQQQQPISVEDLGSVEFIGKEGTTEDVPIVLD